MKVYISSTYEDLRPHRAAVAAALRRMGHIVVGMEDYVAEGAWPLDLCVRHIAGCDVLVGIIAWAYGFVPAAPATPPPPAPGPAPPSMVESEIQAAKVAGKDILIFLLGPKSEWPAHLIDAVSGAGPRGPELLIRYLDHEEARRMATLDDWNRLAPRPSRPRKAGYDWDVFLSYRSLNRRWVIQLYDVLKLSGFDVFLDQYVLTPSQILVGGLQQGLARSVAGVMVWSSSTADSKWCEREYLSMEAQRTSKPDEFHYVVVKLDSTPLPLLAGQHIYVDFQNSPEGPRGIELLRLLYGALGKPLPDEAIRLANEVDVETVKSLAEVKAARLAGDHERLVSLAGSKSLAWITYPMLGCEAADALISIGKRDEALAILDDLIGRFPESIRPKQLKGLTVARKGDWKGAQAVLGPLVAVGERDPETLGIYARTWMDRYRESGNILHLATCRGLYAEAFRNAPHDYYGGINAASKSVLLGEFDVAQEFADAVEKLVGTVSTPFNYWRSATAGEVQLIKRKYAEAARIYKEAVSYAPEETDSHGSTWLQAQTLMDVLKPTPEERAQVAGAFAHLEQGNAASKPPVA